jgi:hypothetical protein
MIERSRERTSYQPRAKEPFTEKPTPATSGGEGLQGVVDLGFTFQAAMGLSTTAWGKGPTWLWWKEWVSPGDRTQVPLRQ